MRNDLSLLFLSPAQPQNKAEIKEDPLSQEPVACCVSTGGRPPASISWSLGGEPNTSQAVGPLPGTFTVTSLLTLKPSSQINLKNITCIVKHETYEKPVTLPVHCECGQVGARQEPLPDCPHPHRLH